MMNHSTLSTDSLIQQAHKALQSGDRLTARRLACLAAAQSPDREEPWRILAQIGSPAARATYMKKADKKTAETRRRRVLAWFTAGFAVLTFASAALAEIFWISLFDHRLVVSFSCQSPMFSTVISPLLSIGDYLPAAQGILSQPLISSSTTPTPEAAPTATLSPTATTTPLPTSTLLPTATPTAAPTHTPTALPSPILQPTATPTPEPEASEEPEETEPEPVTYTVKRGDSLTKIAQRYGVNLTDLVRLNQIANPSSIKPGMVLSIPGGAAQPGKPASNSPSSNPAQSSAGNKRILVDISEQHLWAYEGDALIFDFVASTGINNYTRVGTFYVQSKIPNAWSGYGFWMPYWLGIYWVGTAENGIHSLPVLTNGRELWGNLLGRPATYGCVMLSPSDSKRLYEWATIGTPVEIRR